MRDGCGLSWEWEFGRLAWWVDVDVDVGDQNRGCERAGLEKGNGKEGRDGRGRERKGWDGHMSLSHVVGWLEGVES